VISKSILKKNDPVFAKNFETGYEHFKIGVLLKQAREESGLTQEELASRLNTKNLLFQELKIMQKI